jgi:hypothetical protein
MAARAALPTRVALDYANHPILGQHGDKLKQLLESSCSGDVSVDTAAKTITIDTTTCVISTAPKTRYRARVRVKQKLYRIQLKRLVQVMVISPHADTLLAGQASGLLWQNGIYVHTCETHGCINPFHVRHGNLPEAEPNRDTRLKLQHITTSVAMWEHICRTALQHMRKKDVVLFCKHGRPANRRHLVEICRDFYRPRTPHKHVSRPLMEEMIHGLRVSRMKEEYTLEPYIQAENLRCVLLATDAAVWNDWYMYMCAERDAPAIPRKRSRPYDSKVRRPTRGKQKQYGLNSRDQTNESIKSKISRAMALQGGDVLHRLHPTPVERLKAHISMFKRENRNHVRLCYMTAMKTVHMPLAQALYVYLSKRAQLNAQLKDKVESTWNKNGHTRRFKQVRLVAIWAAEIVRGGICPLVDNSMLL